jgi:hypothetical protein
MTSRALATAAAAAILAAGCGGASKPPAPVNPNAKEVSPPGDIPDDQVFVAYSPPAGGFSVKVPEGWARTTTGGATTFTDKLNAVTVETVAARAPLTVREARATELPKLARTVKGFAAAKASAVTRKAGMAVRLTYLANAPVDPVTGRGGRDAVERYVFFHGGKDVILTLRGPKGADNVDPWRLVSDSLRWTP